MKIIKTSLLYFFLLLCLFITTLNAQTNIDEVFDHLNLDFPGLELVKKSYQSGDFARAKEELLNYYLHLTSRKFIDPEKIYPHDLEKADQNTKNIFVIKSAFHDFGDKINWKFIYTDKEWQFTLNKMNWFKNFIGSYQTTKAEKYVHAWMKQVESWIDLGDPGYPRTIDSGVRLDIWVISYWMFVHELRSPSITPEFNAKILLSMYEQAEFLFRPEHWRRYSNWGSFENSGFSKFVIMFPEFKRNEAWLKEIYFRMHFQLTESYHKDGMHIEVSPSYHAHELKVWHDFLRLAALNGVTNPWHSQIPLSPPSEFFLPPAKALMHFYKPTGVVPQVGDTDEADERDFLLDLGSFWNLPELPYVATNGKLGQSPQETSAAFPEGGYYIMRSGWGNNSLPFNEELYLLFDCGTNYPWHAHYDMLNIVATAYEHDLLKDPGRFTYNDGDERDYFKSTAAHNTIVIDGQDQPQKYTPPKAEWHSLAGFDYVIGTQNSYSMVIHQRSVFFNKPKYWIIVDRLSGSGNHHYDQYWHLSEKALGKIKINETKQSLVAPHFLLSSLLPDASMKLEEGWISYHYREKVEAPIICNSFEGEPPIVLPTVLYPFKSKKPELEIKPIAIESKQDSTNAVALFISSEKGADFFFEQEHAGNISKIKEIETNAKLLFLCLDNQKNIIQYQSVHGSFIKFQGEKVLKIKGKHCVVSVQPNRIEIVGECITDFQLKVSDDPEVILNGEKIEFKKQKNIISLN